MVRLGFGKVLQGLVVLGMLGLIPLFPGDQGPEVALAQVGVGPQTNAFVVGQFSSRTDVVQRSVTVITVRNNRDFLNINNLAPNTPGPCQVSVLWQRPNALGGGTQCVIGPLNVPAGQTVQFCSRRLPLASGISGCDAVCTDGMPVGSFGLAGPMNSTVGVAIVQTNQDRPCAQALTVNPQIFYTIGNQDDMVAATSTPKVIKGAGAEVPTGNMGD